VACQVEVSWICEPCGLTVENSLAEGALEKCVLHIELLNWPLAGDSNSEHRANGDRFHNRAKSFAVVDPWALSETPEDPASLVAIKGLIDTKLVREDPLASDDVGVTEPRDKLPGPIAHQGSVLILHSRMPIGVGKRSMYRGRDRGRCRWRRRGSEDQTIRKHLETRLGSNDHPVRIHRRSQRYSCRRSSIRRRRSRAHGRRWRRLPRSLGVNDRRGRPLTRWWTIRDRMRCSSRMWHNRRLRSCAWRSRCCCGRTWGRLGHVRRSRRRRGRTGKKS
jgi:hypothetical protein